ncbi:MAG: sensor histidine kinase, partial [Dehalococcoidia bacterium]
MRQLIKEIAVPRPPVSASVRGRTPKPGRHKELETLLPELFATAVALMSASSGSLWRTDAGGRLRIVLAHNLPPHLRAVRCPVERWTALAPGADHGPLLLPAPGEAALAFPVHSSNGHKGWALCAPLALQGELLGLLNLNLSSPLDQELDSYRCLALQALAGQAATALYCLQLHRMVKDRERRAAALRRAAIEAKEEERQRLRIEVHDRVAQSLAPALYYLQAYEKTPQPTEEGRLLVSKAQRFVQEAMQEARQIITDLRPPALEALGLAAALRLDVEELAEEMGWQVELELADRRLPRDVELTLYRIAHEALANARKHARTQHLALRLLLTTAGVVLQVQDFGVGFD